MLFRLFLFFSLSLLASLTLYSFSFYSFWAAVNKSVFIFLNQGVLQYSSFKVIVAILSQKIFIFILFLVVFFIFWKKIREVEEGGEYIVILFFMVIFAVPLIQFFTSYIALYFSIDISSDVVFDVLILSEFITWINFSDYAENNFLSHKIAILTILSAFTFRFIGMKNGILLSFFFFLIGVFPSLITGVIWLSDVFLEITVAVYFALLFLCIFQIIPYLIDKIYFYSKDNLFLKRLTKIAQDPSSVSLTKKGFCMGGADVVPGISGATLAYILGIYESFIAAVKSSGEAIIHLVKGRGKKAIETPHWMFLCSIGFGILLGIIFFTKIILLPKLLIIIPQYIYSVFFGLILSSTIILFYKKIPKNFLEVSFILLGIAFGFLIAFLVPVNTPDNNWFIFISGVFAVCAMLLPGLSGSFILLILGKYALIMEGIGNFDGKILIPFLLGAISGMIAFSYLLKSLLDKFYDQTIIFVTGLLFGSLYAIWPFQKYTYLEDKIIQKTPLFPAINNEFFISLLLFAISFSLIFLFERLSRKQSA